MQRKKFLCATLKSFPQSKLQSEKVFEFNHAENLTGCWCNDVFLLRCNLKWGTLNAPSFKSMSSFSSFNTERRKNKQNIEASVVTECRVGSVVAYSDILKPSWQPAIAQWQRRWSRRRNKEREWRHFVKERGDLCVWHVAFSFAGIFCGEGCWQFEASSSVFLCSFHRYSSLL